MRIAGPAHRRPGSIKLERRHIISWCIVSVIVATVLVQWGISAINGGSAQKEGWAGPPPVSWQPAAPTTTVTTTSTATPKPSKANPTLPPHIALPVESPDSVPSSTHSRTAKPHPLLTGPPTAHITSPDSGTQVSGQPGVLMEGTASHLGSRKLEIFDYAPNNVYYLASDHGAVPVSGGHWSFQDATIGDGSNDVGKAFTLTAVIADTTCQATLRSTPRDNDNNISYTTLPSGCRNADRVEVVKTAP